MYRLRVAAVVVLAVLLAAQLTLHNHSLIPEGGGATALPCAVCAFGADQAAIAPLLTAALAIISILVASEPLLIPRAIVVTSDGRAPPRFAR